MDVGYKMKIAMIGPWDRLIWSGRKGLIKALIERGHEVVAISPVSHGGQFREKLIGIGVRHIEIELTRFLNPKGDFEYVKTLQRILSQEKPEIVHTFTMKPNVWGTLAARRAKVPAVVSLVEGFGFMYSDAPGWKPALKRKILMSALRFGFKRADRVWFMNQDDMKDSIRENAIRPEKAVFIRSCGVDSSEFSPAAVPDEALAALRAEFGATEETRFVVCVGRMTWQKGVREFVDASKIVAKTVPGALFLLLGEIQKDSPDVVDEAYLRDAASPNFRWLDFRNDVPALMKIADVVVLPTYYREGVPAVLLQAMAFSKPLVATDWVGCREVVRDGVNGYLCPIKDATALADRIQRVLTDSDLARRFGENGRKMIDEEFEERIIVDQVLEKLYRIA